jgi:hypothetical protein
MTLRKLEMEFVEYIPTDLQEGTIYLSVPYATAVHMCACGCANKVVTPFSPAHWKLVYDGETVTLIPSIGNWQLPCRSHYLIRRNVIIWSTAWSETQIDDGKERDALARRAHFDNERLEGMRDLSKEPAALETSNAWHRFWSLIQRRFSCGGATTNAQLSSPGTDADEAD